VKRYWLSAIALTAVLLTAGGATAAEKKSGAGFGTLDPMTPRTARAKAAAWLKEAGHTDAATTQQFEAIWAKEGPTVLDRLADTFALGDPAAAAVLKQARDTLAPAPTKVPDQFKDASLPEFYRANLALAYARALSNRRIHEEALEALKLFTAEQVADPASFLFHRSVCEHGLLQKDEAKRSIRRLLEEAGSDAPERYKTVALLMQLDMAAWKDKDLSSIARKMKNVERRLDLGRGGSQTQEKEDEILARLDEMIKKLEQQAKSGGT
jgi:hypothetical protein